ncbi:MAG: PAS domain S-box protein, partial [Syntrophus sp. (in: bacteria)]
MTEPSRTNHELIEEISVLKQRIQELEQLESERKQAEDALLESEERFSSLVSNIPGIVYRCANDSNWTMLYISQEIDPISDYPASDFINNAVRSYASIIHPDDRDLVDRAVQKGVKEKADYSMEYRICRADGSISWVSERGQGIFDPNGNLLWLVGVILDQNKFKRTEEELHLFKDLVEHSSDAIGMSTPEGRHYYQNEAFDRLFGDVGDFPPDTVYVDKAIGKQVFDTIMGGRRWQGEVKMFKADRTILDIYLRAYAIKNQDGLILGLVGLHTDNTKRKRAEEALHASQELERSILLSVPYGLFGVEQRRIFFANNAMEDIFGWKPDELIGKSTRIIFRNDKEWEEYGALLYSKLKMQPVFVFEWDTPFIRKDGREIFCRMSVSRTGKELEERRRIVATFEDITDRKRMEEALRGSEEKYRLIAENTADIISVVDMNLRFTYISPSISLIRGFTVEEAMEQTLDQIMTPESQQIVLAIFDEEMKLEISGTADPNRTRILELEEYMKDGSLVWLEIGLSFLRDKDGKPIAILAVSRDISKRKQTEAELEINKNRLYRAEIISRSGNWEFDLKSNRVFGSDGARKIYGLPDSEWTIPAVQKIPLPEYREMLDKAFQDLINENRPYDIEFKIRRPNTGETVDIHSIAEYDHNRNLVFGVIQDITDRKKSEETLRETQRRLSDIIEFLPDATFVIDRDEKVIAWNRAIEAMTGIRKEEMLGKTKHEYAIPFYGDRRPILIDLALHPDKEMEKRYTAIQRMGDILFGESFTPNLPPGDIHLSATASVLRDSRGDIIAAIECIRDNTERKRLEESLNRAEKMEGLGRMAGGVAHDLNNVLGVLVGYSELLAEKLPAGSPLRRYAENIQQSSMRGAAIIQDLLTLARRGVTVSEVVDLNRVIFDYLRTPEFETLKSYHLNVKILTELEECLLNIKGSPVHLGKTIMNLISNAAEAISDQGEVTIRTENRYLDQPIRGYDDVQEGDYVVLTVSDSGKGISSQDIGKIFEPFYTKKVMGKSG